MGIFDVTDVAISVKSWYASYSEPAKKGCTPSKDTYYHGFSDSPSNKLSNDIYVFFPF